MVERPWEKGFIWRVVNIQDRQLPPACPHQWQKEDDGFLPMKTKLEMLKGESLREENLVCLKKLKERRLKSDLHQKTYHCVTA